MDLGSLLKEKLGGAHGDADMSEEDAFDRLYDALKSGDRDEARDAFEHAVYEHQMALDDEDDEDLVGARGGFPSERGRQSDFPRSCPGP